MAYLTISYFSRETLNMQYLAATRNNFELESIKVNNPIVNEKLMLIEAERLKVLPLDLLTSFEKFWEDYLPVLAAGMLLFNTMLMFLADMSLSSLGQSILPYYVTSLIVLATPFVAYWAWMLDLISVDWLDSLVNRYLVYQRREAQFVLDDQGEDLLVKSADDPDIAVTLASLQLLASMDVEIMADEIRALKTQRAGVRPLLVPTTSTLLVVSASQLERLLSGGEHQIQSDNVTDESASLKELLAKAVKHPVATDDEEFLRRASLKLSQRSDSLVVVPDRQLLNTLRAVRAQVRAKEGEVEGFMGLVISAIERLESRVVGGKISDEN